VTTNRRARFRQRSLEERLGERELSAPRRSDASELPVPAERRGDDLFGGARLRADVVAHRDVALHDRVPQYPEVFDLDLDDVAGLDRP
jgi:hypothetical protein